jgi:hypothetical protein
MLKDGIAAYAGAIRDAFRTAGRVRVEAAVAPDAAADLWDRLIVRPMEARFSSAGLWWTGAADDVAAEIGDFWSVVTGPCAATAEVRRYRKGAWTEPETLAETTFLLEVTPVGWDEACGGHTVADGAILPMSRGTLDVFGPGVVLEVPLLVVHRDRLLVRGVLR